MFPEYDWVNDRVITDGCSRRRPDMLVDMGSHVIIIEVDENQHTSYVVECETRRLNDISLDLNCRPVMMIRFNPDSYKRSTGENVTSCWSVNNTSGILVIKKSKQDEWNYRLEILRNTIYEGRGNIGVIKQFLK
jgi:hypothetical protein